MAKFTIRIEGDGMKDLDRWQREAPTLRRVILQRFGAKIAANTQVNLKTGRFGVVSGAHGRTGRLANSIWFNVVSDSAVEVGDVRSGSNVRYALAQEAGFSGTQIVRSHVRRSAFGRPTRPYTVPSFSRKMNLPAHYYQRNTIREFLDSGLAGRISEGAFNEHKRRLGWD